MSRENVEIVRRGFELHNTAGFDAVAEQFWHPEVEYREDPMWPEASVYRGRDAVLAAFKRYEEVMGRYEATVERIVDGGDRLGVVIRSTGHGVGSGLPHEHRWGYLVRLEDKRLIYLQAFYDANQALEAAGLSE